MSNSNSATLRAKSPLVRDGKKHQECCVLSEELRVTLNALRSECTQYRA